MGEDFCEICKGTGEDPTAVALERLGAVLLLTCATCNGSGTTRPRSDEQRITVNPEPLAIKPIPVCRGCNKRAPWCSCGAADYTPSGRPKRKKGK